jgi:hypothetical protein
MPSNLNALIRYKTLNSCLYGGRRKWSIQELTDACSEALSEARGRYDPVSERTIRDDIRIMRSDILGFNAPIKQEKGMYYYSDREFSILTVRITDAGLADKIYDFLISLRNERKHPELEIILEQLCGLTKRSYEKPIIAKEVKPEGDLTIRLRRGPKEEKILNKEPWLSEQSQSWLADDLSIVAEEQSESYLQKNLNWEVIIEKIIMDFFLDLV